VLHPFWPRPLNPPLHLGGYEQFIGPSQDQQYTSCIAGAEQTVWWLGVGEEAHIWCVQPEFVPVALD
jgi:hypothetical protein